MECDGVQECVWIMLVFGVWDCVKCVELEMCVVSEILCEFLGVCWMVGAVPTTQRVNVGVCIFEGRR